MDFTLSEAERLIRDTAREFAEKELKPVAAELDRQHRFPEKPLRRLAELGMMGMTVPEADGGPGASAVAHSLALMEVSRACASTGGILSVHNTLACECLVRYGTEAQKQKYLPALIRGTTLGAFALTEPESGSDAAGLKTVAVRQGNRYLLTGTKAFVTSGGRARMILTFATVASERGRRGITAFLVEPSFPGFAVGRVEEKMGLNASETVQLHLDACEVPAENRLGEEGAGFEIALELLEGGRAGIAAQAVGIAQACLEEAVAYAKERRQFGRPIGSFQAIQHQIADMATQVEAARLLTLRAAALKDAGQPVRVASSMAKLYASETANRVA
ncbi:MAG TPA: acyl-CoA dehydrogenase family protein, partial [Candidatus Methylomirabilis sp.]|nr:acyl-CoA dehydrogenase family protein [Candidatus Methylomirabilis sp.]